MSERHESPTSERISSKASRLAPLDALRGLIIVLMALDHANYFVARQHSSGEYWGGSFPVYPDALAFITRLVTHLAAPGFFFLMGAGMVLFVRSRRQRGWGKWSIIRHFLIRGGFLIALQLLLVNRAWGLYGVGWGYIGVLFALGGTMILGSILLWLRLRYLLALTAVLVLGTELLTPNPSQWNQAFPLLSRLLLVPGGTSIPQMYPYWLLGLLIVYPLCLWYGRLKHRQPATSILRFF